MRAMRACRIIYYASIWRLSTPVYLYQFVSLLPLLLRLIVPQFLAENDVYMH